MRLQRARLGLVLLLANYVHLTWSAGLEDLVLTTGLARLALESTADATACNLTLATLLAPEAFEVRGLFVQGNAPC